MKQLQKQEEQRQKKREPKPEKKHLKDRLGASQLKLNLERGRIAIKNFVCYAIAHEEKQVNE